MSVATNRQLWIVCGAVLLAIAVGYLAYLNRNFQLDDALIYQRYSRNVLEGYGPVFNLDERVNALTSPLFFLVSTVAAYAVVDLQLASVVVAATTLFLTLLIWWRLFAAACGSLGAAAGVALTILFPYLYVTFGMETCLFLFLIGLCIQLYGSAAERGGGYSGLGIAAALLVLTRPEGAFLILALAVEHLRKRKPLPHTRSFLAPASILGIYFLYNWIYYGALFSDTAAVKIIQGRSGFWGPWPPFARVGYQLDWFFDGEPVRLTALGSLALLGASAGRRTMLFRVSTLFLIFLTLFYVVFSLPNYHWYYAPYYLLGLFWAGCGASWLWNRTRQIRTPLLRGATSTAVAGFVTLLLASGARDTFITVERSQASHPYRAIGEWLAENTTPDASVAAMEIGFLGWYSNRYLIDIVGLVTPENARFLAEGRYDAWLEHHDPDYIVTHDPLWRLERAAGAAVRSGEYRPVDSLELVRYQLLERSPESGLGSVEEAMKKLRDRPDSELRSRVLAALLDRRLGPLVELGDSDVLAANMSPDRWTRGTTPAAMVIQNRGDVELRVTLRLTCLAERSDLPMITFLDDGESLRQVEFTEPGSRRVELAPVPVGSIALVAIWSDTAWQPEGRDQRWLGVNIDRAD